MQTGRKKVAIFLKMVYIIIVKRGVAQFGSALGSGPRGREFESRHLDQKKQSRQKPNLLFLLVKRNLSSHPLRFRTNTKKGSQKGFAKQKILGKRSNRAKSHTLAKARG